MFFVNLVLPSFHTELLGTLKVGVPGKELAADFIGGMDTSVASSFYFYATFGELYFQSIAKAFDIRVALPQLLVTSKFGCGNVVVGSTSLASGKDLYANDKKTFLSNFTVLNHVSYIF